jgi:hypothetical protein
MSHDLFSFHHIHENCGTLQNEITSSICHYNGKWTPYKNPKRMNLHAKSFAMQKKKIKIYAFYILFKQHTCK